MKSGSMFAAAGVAKRNEKRNGTENCYQSLYDTLSCFLNVCLRCNEMWMRVYHFRII